MLGKFSNYIIFSRNSTTNFKEANLFQIFLITSEYIGVKFLFFVSAIDYKYVS